MSRHHFDVATWAAMWAEFQELFMGKYFPETARHAKA